MIIVPIKRKTSPSTKFPEKVQKEIWTYRCCSWTSSSPDFREAVCNPPPASDSRALHRSHEAQQYALRFDWRYQDIWLPLPITSVLLNMTMVERNLKGKIKAQQCINFFPLVQSNLAWIFKAFFTIHTIRKRFSPHTLLAYESDLIQFFNFQKNLRSQWCNRD